MFFFIYVKMLSEKPIVSDQLFKRGKARDIVIAFTPMNNNIEDVPKLIEFALGKRITVIQFPPLSSSGRAKANWDELRLSNDKRLWFWVYMWEQPRALVGAVR